jgi:hypothetical protein
MTQKFYAVPSSIAEALKLTKLRKMDADGCFLLAGFDLQGYGIERAIREGAEVIDSAEAHTRFNG